MPEAKPPAGDELKFKPSRIDQARQVAQEYAADLREIIKKLRRKLH